MRSRVLVVVCTYFVSVADGRSGAPSGLSSGKVTTADGREFTLTPEMVTVERKTFKQSGAPRPTSQLAPLSRSPSLPPDLTWPGLI